MRGSRVLVTGGGGLIGSTLVRHLLDRGAREVVAFDSFARGTRSNLDPMKATGKVRIVEGDIRDAGAVRDAVTGAEYIFHQAALRVTVCEEAPKQAVDVMIHGTLNLLDAAAGAGAKKIVFASAAAVYGNPIRLPVEEDHPLLDTSVYGACKIAGERLTHSWGHSRGLAYVVLRYFNVYGPGMDLSSPHREVMVRWLDRIDAGNPPIIFGGGEQSMDFVHVDDVAEANLRAMESDVSGEIFNVGTGKETTLLSLAETLVKLAKSNLRPEFQSARQVNTASRRFASTRKAADLLGFEARLGLEDGLAGLMEWRKARKVVPRDQAA